MICPLGKFAGDMGEGAHPISVSIKNVMKVKKNYCSESVSLECSFDCNDTSPSQFELFILFFNVFELTFADLSTWKSGPGCMISGTL